jgi:hypothetical protein
MKVNNISNVSLVYPDNMGYLRQGNYRKRVYDGDRQNKKYIKNTLARDYISCLNKWERGLQKLLASLIAEESQRILRFHENGIIKHREIHFIGKLGGDALIFCELKLKQKYKKEIKSSSSGWSQLNKAIAIAETQYRKVVGLSICVDLSGVLEIKIENKFSEHNKFNEIKDYLLRALYVKNVAWLDSVEIAKILLSENLISQADINELKMVYIQNFDAVKLLNDEKLPQNPQFHKLANLKNVIKSNKCQNRR